MFEPSSNNGVIDSSPMDGLDWFARDLEGSEGHQLTAAGAQENSRAEGVVVFHKSMTRLDVPSSNIEAESGLTTP